MNSATPKRLPPPVFFYLTAALCGAGIMMVEILGAKLLAPYVGTSHFVWLAQITVTLLALALGYFAGGKLAERRPNPAPAFLCIGAAGLYLGLGVAYVREVAYACLNLELALGSLLASAFLFFLPLGLLAATAPFYVQLLTRDVAQVGKLSGRLSAAGTLGSVLGTVLVGYFVIPSLPNSATMYLIAAVLFLWSVFYFLRFGRANKPLVAVVATLGLWALGGGFATQRAGMPLAYLSRLYRAQSPFGELQVMETPDGRDRLLLDDLLYQNIYDPVRGQSIAEFTYLLQFLSEAYTPKLDRVLCLGMGMGIVPMELSKKGAQVDVVEINEAMVEPAERFFGCDTKAFRLTIGDARTFLNQTKPGTYDSIIVDVFAGDASPAHLFSAEALGLIRRALKPGGTLVMNTFGYFEPGRDFFLASLDRTLREGAGFPFVRIHSDDDGGNVYFLASDTPPQLERFPDFSQVHPRCRDAVTNVFNRTFPAPKGGQVLTDDYNPVECFDAPNRESLRRNYARAARSY